METKIKYKLIFSDLDHTLLVDNHIPSFNLEAIQKAREKGVKFVICTGRPFKIMNHLLKELNTENSENEYTVCSSGSLIYENKNEKIIYSKEIDFETLKLLFEYGKTLDISMTFEALKGRSYVYKEEKTDKKDWKSFRHKTIKNIDDLKDIKIIRVLFNKKDYNYLFNIQNDIRNNKTFEGKITCFISGNRCLEINSFGASKGEALKWLSSYLNIDIKETIAIGDDYNDESMMKEAGLSCSVKSAQDDIKKLSKYICEKDYFEGSVKEVIDKFILN